MCLRINAKDVDVLENCNTANYRKPEKDAGFDLKAFCAFNKNSKNLVARKNESSVSPTFSPHNTKAKPAVENKDFLITGKALITPEVSKKAPIRPQTVAEPGMRKKKSQKAIFYEKGTESRQKKDLQYKAMQWKLINPLAKQKVPSDRLIIKPEQTKIPFQPVPEDHLVGFEEVSDVVELEDVLQPIKY